MLVDMSAHHFRPCVSNIEIKAGLHARWQQGSFFQENVTLLKLNVYLCISPSNIGLTA